MQPTENREENALKLFLIITIGLSIILEAFIVVSKAMGLSIFLMWIPGLTAILIKMIYFRKEKGFLGFRKCKFKYIFEAILIPLIYIGVPYIIYWIIYPGTLQFQITPEFWLMLIFCIPFSMITAIGEEIGWRGFMVPAFLKKMGLKKALLLSGFIWGMWHVPVLVSGLYMPGTPVWYKVPMFLIIVLACGCMIGIVRIESESVWPAVLMHAAHNAFDQTLFGHYTAGGPSQMYFVSETGIFTAIIAWIIVMIMYKQVKTK